MMTFCSFHRFKQLPTETQINQLGEHGIALDLACVSDHAEKVLFAYGDFYVELVVDRFTDVILDVHCFKSTVRLEAYLQQVDISEITLLLSCNEP